MYTNKEKCIYKKKFKRKLAIGYSICILIGAFFSARLGFAFAMLLSEFMVAAYLTRKK